MGGGTAEVEVRLVGAGKPVSGAGFEGRIAKAGSVPEVLAMLDEDVSEVVLLTEQASATFFAPILPRIRGVICTRGGESAHLAIVSRGLDLPCLMQARLDEDLEPGAQVVVDDDGRIRTR